MKHLLAHRTFVSVVIAGSLALTARSLAPWRPDDPIFVLISVYHPTLYRGLYIGYVTLLFTTPYLVSSVLGSLTYIFMTGRQRGIDAGPLPPYPDPSARRQLFVILGELHHALKPVPAAAPTWLTIPERGLFTGIAVIGAVGSGKTTGCLYPYTEQILGYRRADPERRIGGVVLEVKGDFCHDVRRMLEAHGRAADYVEVSLDGPWRYNPLHNDLDAYALAYGIASLLNSVFGKGKEPFWQQAYTNLIKFIILLHKVVDDYVTLFDVYECAINPDRLAAKIAEGERQFCAPKRLLVSSTVYADHPVLSGFTFEQDPQTRGMSAPESAGLRRYVETHAVPYQERAEPFDDASTHDPRQLQLEAVKRWYEHDWRRIEPKLRTSIVEGISVFLSLFDDSPAVKRVFCPPKACYDPVANVDGRYGQPLPPFGTLIEARKVCALNFPMAANPGLAKIVGTMMKQDFQRAVLSRIPRIAAQPDRQWREVLFSATSTTPSPPPAKTTRPATRSSSACRDKANASPSWRPKASVHCARLCQAKRGERCCRPFAPRSSWL